MYSQNINIGGQNVNNYNNNSNTRQQPQSNSWGSSNSGNMNMQFNNQQQPRHGQQQNFQVQQQMQRQGNLFGQPVQQSQSLPLNSNLNNWKSTSSSSVQQLHNNTNNNNFGRNNMPSSGMIRQRSAPVNIQRQQMMPPPPQGLQQQQQQQQQRTPPGFLMSGSLNMNMNKQNNQNNNIQSNNLNNSNNSRAMNNNNNSNGNNLAPSVAALFRAFDANNNNTNTNNGNSNINNQQQRMAMQEQQQQRLGMQQRQQHRQQQQHIMGNGNISNSNSMNNYSGHLQQQQRQQQQGRRQNNNLNNGINSSNNINRQQQQQLQMQQRQLQQIRQQQLMVLQRDLMFRYNNSQNMKALNDELQYLCQMRNINNLTQQEMEYVLQSFNKSKEMKHQQGRQYNDNLKSDNMRPNQLINQQANPVPDLYQEIQRTEEERLRKQQQNQLQQREQEHVERRQRSILSVVGIDLSLSPERNVGDTKSIVNSIGSSMFDTSNIDIGNNFNNNNHDNATIDLSNSMSAMSMSLASARDDELRIIQNSPALKKKPTGKRDQGKTELTDLCTLTVEPSNAGPEDKVIVTWEMPKSFIARGDWIGIYRIHQKTFQSCMTSRYVYTTKRGNRNARREFEMEREVDFHGGHVTVVGGSLVFHAPPAIGRYDFRLFQQIDADRREIQALQQEGKNKKSNKKNKNAEEDEIESYAMPIARSPVLTVESQGRAFVSSLKFLRKRIEGSIKTFGSGGSKKKSQIPREYLGSLNQLVRLLEQVRDDGPGAYIDEIDGKQKPKLAYADDLWPIISICVKKSIEIPKPKIKINDGDGDPVFEKEDRDIFSLHKTTRDILLLTKLNPTVWRLLEDDEKFQINSWYEGYWLERVENLALAYDEKSDVGEKCVKLYPSSISSKRINAISSTIQTESPKLMSTNETEKARLELRNRLEQILKDLPYQNITLGIFGSSMNNFGSPKSDLDMCLQIPADVVDEVDQQQIIEQLADILPKYGMKEIDTVRITARIPIIQFVDGKTGIECDVCVNNSLALRNTRLLRSYSYADPRVRQVAYIIKKWSKSRKINDPSKSTLSSYGYILTLLQSLQLGGWVPSNVSKLGTHKPLLPFIQQHDDMWDGISEKYSNPEFLPQIMVPTLSGDTVDSYFFDATRDERKKFALQKFASQCICPVGKLLLEYFWYYGFVFQWRREIVSVRKAGLVLKHEKARDFGWKRNGHLSISDPFEIGYNVAHVLRPNTNKRLRDEFIRAYCILAGIGDEKVDPNVAIEKLFEDYIEPVVEEDEAEEENISENADNKKVVTSKAEVLVVVEEGDTLVKARNKGKNKQKKKTFANNKKSRASKKNKGKGRGRSKE